MSTDEFNPLVRVAVGFALFAPAVTYIIAEWLKLLIRTEDDEWSESW